MLCRKLSVPQLKDHEVVSQHAEIDFGSTGWFIPSAQAVAQPPLVLADGTLHVPALAGLLLGEVPLHLQPVRRLRHGFGPAAVVYGDDGTPDAEFLSTEPMMGLAVEGRVCVQGVDRHPPARLPHERGQQRRFVARPDPGQGSDKHIGAVFAEHREPWEGRGAFGPPLSTQEIGADVAALQSRGVQRGLNLVRNQPAVGRAEGNRVSKGDEKPLFFSRCSAFCTVVK